MAGGLRGALDALGKNLGIFAQYQASEEEREDREAFSEKMLASQQAFQERLFQLESERGERTMASEREFRREERKETQLFQMEMFKAENAAAERRFAMTMGSQMKQFELQLKQFEATQEAVGVNRQFEALKLELQTQAGALEETVKARTKAIEALTVKTDEKISAVMSQYEPTINEAKESIRGTMDQMRGLVKLPTSEELPVGAAGAAGATGAERIDVSERHLGVKLMRGEQASSSVNQDNVEQAVAYARKELGARALTVSHDELTKNFMAMGLNREEASAAAAELKAEFQGAAGLMK